MPNDRSAAKPRGINATAGTILGFLIDASLSGYEIFRSVERTVGDFWNVTQSQVYREIANLERAGFIKPGRTGARARKRYALTPAGKGAFLQWASLEPGEAIVRDPFFLKIFFAEHLDRETLQRFVRRRRAEHESRLAQSLEQERRAPEGAAKRALQFGIRYERALLDWLENLPWK